MAKQVIKIKKVDLNRAIVRGLSRTAWEKKKSLPSAGGPQVSRKLKPPRYKKKFKELENEM
ncbi:MAG: hypothetical protein WC545_00135 [Patescibacteria group bacterium]